MKHQLILASLLLSFCTIAFAQSPMPPACLGYTGSTSCANACVVCGAGLANYGSTTQGNPTPVTITCAGSPLSVYNPQWVAFVAGSSSSTIRVESPTCASNTFYGAIFKDCSMTNPLACGSSPATTHLDLAVSGLQVGATYFLLMGADVPNTACGFYTTVITGSTVAPALGQMPTDLQGPSFVCPDLIATYSIPSVSGAGYYTWTAPSGALINGSPGPVTLSALDNGNQVTITFGSAGGTVTVKALNACYDNLAPISHTISMQPLITVLGPITISANVLPFTWPQDPSVKVTTLGTFNLQTVLNSWLGCDSIVQQVVHVVPAGMAEAAGLVYQDLNNNHLRDAGEPVYTAGALVQTSGGLFATSGVNGVYMLSGLAAGDTIRVVPPPGATVSPAFRKYDPLVLNGYDFGIFYPQTFFDLSVDLANVSVFRQGFTTTLQLTVHNSGNATVNGVQASLALPYFLDFQSASLAPNSIAGDTLRWNLGTLAPNATRVITLKVTTILGTPNSKPVSIPAWVTPLASDAQPANNFYTLAATTVGSIDPNDKQVQPIFLTPPMLASGQALTYTIRFQNTGTYEADFVRVVDSLGETLDPASFRFLAASHACTWQVHDRGIVEFFLENIHLPDSTSDEPGSHGFVKFAVQAKKNLPIGASVDNHCDIYFDFNQAVRTNTASSPVVLFVPGGGSVVHSPDELKARPNPAGQVQEFGWLTLAPADGLLRYRDALGVARLETPVSAGWTSASAVVSGLPNGLYWVELAAGDLHLQKLVMVWHAGGLLIGN